MQREIKEIERVKLKLEKLFEKMNGGAKKEVVGEEKEDDVDEALGTINDPDTPTAHGNVAEEDGDKAKYLKISKEPEEEKVELDNPLRVPPPTDIPPR